MVKKLFVLFLLLILHHSVFSKKVTEQQALLAGKNFYFERLNLISPVDYKDIETENIIPKTSGDQILYYIITFKNKGFVVVSGNDVFQPVLCYVFDSRYDELNQPPAFIRWMQDYEKQIVSGLKSNTASSPGIAAAWNNLLTATPEQLAQTKDIKSLTPLIKTKWNQGKYYNNNCPAASGGPDNRAYAGCVPTAMGQIMNYYRHPVSGTGSYTYNDTVGANLYSGLTADFGNTVYQWDLMPLEVTERQNDSAVAKLLYHLGVSVDLNYEPDGSGMYNHKAAYALRTYFHYSPDCKYVFRDTATHTNWKQLILSHLDAKKPLYYAGWADTINLSGHAFVCDGYQDTSYFHFNWGWGGSDDGYFLLDNLTPGGSDFTLDHELIINFYPDPSSTYSHPCNGLTTLTQTKGTFSDGSGPLQDYSNNANCTWVIQPSDSILGIQLNFQDFNTEPGNDVVTVYNGSNTSAPLLGTFSGSSLPSQITTTGKALCFTFTSNDSITSGGFLASYTSTIPVFCSGTKYFTTSSGSFGDGSGTFNYHPNELCRWQITPTGSPAITLHFNSFDLTPGDFVRITDLATNTLLANYVGGTVPEDVLCTSGRMQVMFKSYDTVSAQGFSAVYYNSTGVEETTPMEFSFAPNPAKERITMNFRNPSQQDYEVAFYSVEGKIITTHKVSLLPGQYAAELNIANIKPGFYFIEVSGKNETTIKKIIIE